MIDSVTKVNKKHHPQTFLEERKYEIEKTKMENLIVNLIMDLIMNLTMMNLVINLIMNLTMINLIKINCVLIIIKS